MNISLSSTLEDYVNKRLHEGHYASASEIVSEGLQLLIEKDQERAEEFLALKKEIQIGLDQIDQGKTVPMEDVFSKANAIIAKAKNEQV
ncbi:MAG: type II toxin-antitoxin system ParD family antitoxin [Magnetococcales bacterium]|nr:type II toxin-antitoxin system ParD family antitoxin [Magnetococcales bacterium]